MFQHTLPLVRIAGIPVRLDASWFLVAIVLSWSLSVSVLPSDLPGLEHPFHLALGIATMLLFFVSLTVHEFAHALVARRFGVRTGSITLFVFGGIAQLEREPDTPGADASIALAGPGASAVLAGLFALVAAAAAAADVAPFGVVARYLAGANLALAAFNLVPAFPLDGGRVLRAVLWVRSGDRASATRVAARCGIGFGLAMIAAGLLALLAANALSGLWLAVLGFFLVSVARAVIADADARRTAAGATVGDIMSAPIVAVRGDASVAHAVRLMLERHKAYLPVIEGGRHRGTLDLAVLRDIPRAMWDEMRVEEVARAPATNETIAAGTPLVEMLDRIARDRRAKFLVMRDGAPVGIATLSDMAAYLTVAGALGAKPTAPPSRRRARPGRRPARPASALGMG